MSDTPAETVTISAARARFARILAAARAGRVTVIVNQAGGRQLPLAAIGPPGLVTDHTGPWQEMNTRQARAHLAAVLEAVLGRSQVTYITSRRRRVAAVSPIQLWMLPR